MSWTDALLDPGWRTWLLDVAGGSRVRGGAKLDPFGTSLRSLSGQARRWLPLIRAQEPFADTQRRADQTVTDLGAAGLVTGPTSLSELGEAVYERWQAIPDSWEYELPLAVALLQEALLIAQPTFVEMVAFWWDVRSRFGDEVRLLRDEEAVILVPYLNQSSAGFNPWIALREHQGTLALPVPWNDLESAAGGDAAVTSALTRLRGVLDPSRRLKSRVVFCRAMSLLIRRREDPGAVTPYLRGLELPRRAERA